MVDRRLNVLDAGLSIEAPHEIEGALPIRLPLVGEFHARLQPPEQIRHQRKEAVGGELSAVARIAPFTPKISWMTMMPAPRPAAGGAR